MDDQHRTTREHIADRIREEPLSPSALATELGLRTEAVLSHLEHVAQSLEGGGESVLVAPPSCRECGFDGFDDLINRPSRCPECKSEAIDEPVFTVD